MELARLKGACSKRCVSLSVWVGKNVCVNGSVVLGRRRISSLRVPARLTPVAWFLLFDGYSTARKDAALLCWCTSFCFGHAHAPPSLCRHPGAAQQQAAFLAALICLVRASERSGETAGLLLGDFGSVSAGELRWSSGSVSGRVQDLAAGSSGCYMTTVLRPVDSV